MADSVVGCYISIGRWAMSANLTIEFQDSTDCRLAIEKNGRSRTALRERAQPSSQIVASALDLDRTHQLGGGDYARSRQRAQHRALVPVDHAQ
jgi:hypothetical protein